ncbi:hypothetical protein [Pseudonocardia sp. ICBG601]|uniref:DUF6933 domain-containing protein n=1 Tax=Pseudonocardia sp. ICBG601 TaxID=2846759 RepID=UPI001CF67C6D|nr:hypothetical protein [Pseudonocardia sp. ICBG601]
MMIVRATAKVLTAIRQRPDQLPTLPPTGDDWYLHLAWLRARKCLLLTHADTLFSVFIPDIRVHDLRPPGPLLVARIHAALDAADLPTDALGELDPDTVALAKTLDRRVRGVMNDHLYTVEHLLDHHSIGIDPDRPGITAPDTLDLIHRHLRRTINSPTGYTQPIDAIRARLTT